MQHYLSSTPCFRQDAIALLCPVRDANLCRKSPRCVLRSILHVGASSSCLREGSNTLRGGLLCEPSNNKQFGLNFNAMRVVLVATASSSASCQDSRIGRRPTAQKVNWVAVAIALSAGVAVLARVGSAFAVIPSVARSPLVARSGKELLVSGWMGLMAGCLHTLTGPDHLAALAPLSIGRTKLESVAVGALWGCGHDAGQVIFGILFLILKDKLQIEVLRTWGARVVGMTLVAIGIAGMKEAHEAVRVPCLAGSSSSLAHNSSPPMEPLNSARKNTGFTTFATGIVHGLQPDALIMILPALALPSRFAGAAFLSMFLLGTVLSMSSYTAFIGSCSNALQKRIPRITEHLAWGSSFVAILVGVGILSGEVFGLALF